MDRTCIRNIEFFTRRFPVFSVSRYEPNRPSFFFIDLHLFVNEVDGGPSCTIPLIVYGGHIWNLVAVLVDTIPVELSINEMLRPMVGNGTSGLFKGISSHDGDNHIQFAQLYGKCVTRPSLGFGEDGLLSLLDEANRLAIRSCNSIVTEKRGDK